MNEKLTITHIVYTLVSMSCLQYFIIFELYLISIKNSLKKNNISNWKTTNTNRDDKKLGL